MKIIISVLLASALAYAQTDVGGRNFKGRLDATAAPSTAPFTTGLLSARPSACTRADAYFSTDATPGSNLSFCTTTGAPGTWTVVSTSGGALAIANNLSDLGSASTARTNLGLGTAALSAASAFEVPLTFVSGRLTRTVNSVDLASGIVTPASCGDTTHSCSVTVDAYGRVTAATNNAIASGGSGTVTVVSSGSLTSTAVATGGGSATVQTPSATTTLDTSGNFSTPGTLTSGSGTTAGGGAVLGNPTGDTAASFFEANSGDGASNTEPAYLKLWSSHTTKRKAALFPCTNADGFFCIATTTPVADASNIILTTDNTATITNKIIDGSQLVANSVPSSKMAVVNTRRTACIPIGADNAAAVIATADLGPQSNLYFINSAQTLVEIIVKADGGTPNVIVGRNRAGTIVNLTSSALATAASGGQACSKTTATTGLNGVTTCSATLQNTALAAGDWITLVSGTPGGVAKQMSACFTTTVD